MPKIVIITALFLCLLTAINSQAGFEPIIETSRQAQWRPGPGSPEAEPVGNGIKFSYPFIGQTTRLYWDLPVSLDLTKSATIVLDISCTNHEALQSLGLYLKSGNGWYLWLHPLVKSGRQKFFLQIKDAATEGRPAGWNKISGVRVSFQQVSAKNIFMLHGISAGNSGIVLINGTSSVPNDGERAVAKKTTARIGKWLEDIGITHSVFDDEDIISGRIKSAKIIILPYNPQIGQKECRQLERLSANGSKLIVFYGSNPRLAELMNMKLGKYQAAGEPGRWSGFIFKSSAPPGMPPKIIQESGNIYTVLPKSEKSRIIAFWQDASGKLLSDPAWVQSDNGFWMTHILSGEDSENKKRMLLALLGHYEKGIWKEAAQNAIAQTAGGADTAPLTAAWKKGNYIEVVLTADRIKRNLAIAGVMNQNIKANEFRGVWNHSGLGLYPGNWNKTCQLLAQSGITAVFPNILWAGMAHYPSKFVSQSEQSKKYVNQMTQCASAARNAGLELHVWKVCWNLTKAPKDFIENMRKQGRLQRNNHGETLPWLCPSDPANISLELNTIMEVLSDYQIDGIHLDYIRYPDDKTCFCAGCRQRFENWSGQKVKNWPKDVSSGKQSGSYKTWRSLKITEFLRNVRREMKKIKPQAKLSAAVYPKYPE
ncbi:MAG: family 10 glycosylhydrolase, partial [Kiritimatiellia bacterium]|nr:family 10 glycosylhydrolase [Kiritimatiellia bacterium]